MSFAKDVKRLVTEAIKSRNKVFDSSVNQTIYNKSKERIDDQLDKFDLLANELLDQPGNFHFQMKISNIGVEYYIPITGQEGNKNTEPLTREIFGTFTGWRQDGVEPKDTNTLNIILDKNHKIQKVYAGRLREKNQAFLDKYKYVGP